MPSMRRTIPILMLALTVIAVACSPAQPSPTISPSPTSPSPAPSPTTTKVYRVGISYLVTHPSIEATKQGFKEGMAQEGFVEGKNVIYEEQNAQGQVANAKDIADKFASEQLDLVVSFTTPNSQAVVKAIKDKPIVFGMVTDPVAAGLVPSYDKPSGTNVTGVYNFNPVPDQFEIFRRLAPGVKRVGVIYNAGEVNSQVLVKMAKEKAQEFGWEVVEATVSGSADVLTAANSLVGRCDAIYVPQDNTVVSAFDSVLKVAQSNKLPVFAGAPEQVQAGAILTVAYSQKDMGIQIGKLAARVLKGENPGNIAPETPNKKDLYINAKAAETVGINVPDDILKQAVQVYR